MATSSTPDMGNQIGYSVTDGNDIGGAATVLGTVARRGAALGFFGHQEQSQFASCHGGHTCRGRWARPRRPTSRRRLPMIRAAAARVP